MRKILPLVVIGVALLLVAGFTMIWTAPSPTQVVQDYLLSPQEDRAREKLRSLDEGAIPVLLDLLGQGKTEALPKILMGVREITFSWPTDDPRWDRLADRIHANLTSWKKESQVAAWTLIQQAFRPDRPAPSPRWLALAFGLLESEGNDASFGPARFTLMQTLIPHTATDRHRDLLRHLAKSALADPSDEGKIAAIRFFAQEAETETAHLEKSASLIRDASPSVRKAVLMHFGSRVEVVPEQDLLPLLHDPDTETQGLAMLALRGRGLGDQEIQLARFISDAKPGNRLRVLDVLSRPSDLDTGIWLNRLSHDPSPSVRAAALRAAVNMERVEFADRMREMATQDPSSEVRKNAAFYLQKLKANEN